MEFLLIATTHLLALLSPGPDFFLVLQAALRLPRRYGLAICAGIALANALYLALAVSGIEIVRELDWLMNLLRYLGAAYLIFLGIILLRASPPQTIDAETSNFITAPHLGRQFAVGFLSAILNPKNAIFYLSLFTLMVSPDTSFTTRCLYALWMTLVVLLWDAALVLTIGHRRIRTHLGAAVFRLEKLAGIMLTVFVAVLPFT